MKEKNNYRFVKGSRHRGFFGGFSSLWLAGDHLLLLRSSGWADRWRESYRRFYFRDIQALIICETTQRRNWAIALLLSTLFFLVMAALFRESGFLFHLPAALIFLITLLVYWFKGPTCNTHIQTAVQTTQLPCVRSSVAERFKAELLGFIEEEQGHFDAEHTSKVSDQLKAFTAAKAETAALGDDKKRLGRVADDSDSVPPFNNPAHLLTFALFLAQAIISIMAFSSRGQGLFALETVLFVVTLVMIIMALYRQSRSRVRGALVWTTWIGLACMAAFIILTFGLLFVAISSAADMAFLFESEFEMWRMIARVDPADSLYLRLLLAAKAGCYSLLGATGLFLSFRFQRKGADD